MKFCSHLLTPDPIGPLLTLLMFICDLHALPGGKAAPLNYTGGGGRCSAPETFHPLSLGSKEIQPQGNDSPFPSYFSYFFWPLFPPSGQKPPSLQVLCGISSISSEQSRSLGRRGFPTPSPILTAVLCHLSLLLLSQCRQIRAGAADSCVEL